MKNRFAQPAVAVLGLVALLGLYQVKWSHYYRLMAPVFSGHSVAKPVVLVGAQTAAPAWHAAWAYATAYGKSIWQALVLALVLGAGLEALIPGEWISRLLGGGGYRSLTLGAVASIPSMMCTCCAAPLTVALGARGASKGATVAYWLGNPLLNPASLAFTWIILGRNWFVLRIVISLLLVLGAGELAARYDLDAEKSAAIAAANIQASPSASFWTRWLGQLLRLSGRLLPEYGLLIVVLGWSQAWLLPRLALGAAHGTVWLIGMAVAGTLLAVPTAGEIPVVQAVLAAGLGAAPAAGLLVTLPAVSLPSLVMVSKALPARLLVAIALAVAAAGVLAGRIAAALF